MLLNTVNKAKLLPYILFTGLIADASYLSSKYYDFYYRGGFLNSLGCTDDCDTVMMSPYALIFKIPVPFYGLAFYIATLAIYIWWHRTAKQSIMHSPTDISHVYATRALEAALVLGCLAALIFTYILYFQLHAICKFCLAAHGIFVVLSLFYFTKLRAT